MLEEQATTRVPELVPIRLRADAGVAVHVLPRGRLPDGGGSRRRAAHRPARAALRRRAPVELRWVRRARPAAGVRRQRLRRDAAGPVRVGPQAPGGELRGGRPRPRVRRGRARRGQPGGHARPIARRCASSRRCARSISGTRASTSTRSCRSAGRACERQAGDQAVRQERRQGAREGQPARVRQAHPRWSTASRGSSATRR